MDQGNVSFVSLGGGLVASTKQLAFDGNHPVGAEAKELLCVGNASQGKMKTQLLVGEEAENATYRVQPDVAMLGRPAGAHSSWSSWVASSSRRVTVSNSQLSVLSRGWDGGGESIEKARSKLEKFRGFLLAGFC